VALNYRDIDYSNRGREERRGEERRGENSTQNMTSAKEIMELQHHTNCL
jgi:hypothetical protein